jgi:uncharacterized protein YkwD
MRAPLALAVVAAVVLGAALAGAALTSAHATSARTHGGLSARAVKHIPTLEERVLVAINDVRRDHRLAPLRLNAQLAETAREHSVSMAEHGYFQHSTSTGAPFRDRLAKFARAHWRLGENLVWASPGLTAQQAIRMWLNSAPHRRNLLARGWRAVGLGAVHADPAPGVYEGIAATILTADFGVRG